MLNPNKLALVKATCLSDEAFDNTVKERVAEYREAILDPILGEDIARKDKMAAELEKNLRADHDGLLAELVSMYDSEFTEEEQESIRALYESPLWVRFSKAAANMQDKVVQASSNWLMRAQKTIQTEIAEILDAQVKQRQNPAAAAAEVKPTEDSLDKDLWG